MGVEGRGLGFTEETQNSGESAARNERSRSCHQVLGPNIRLWL